MDSLSYRQKEEFTHPKIAIKRLSSKTLAINKYNPSITHPIGSAYALMTGVPNLVVDAKK